MIKVPSVEWVLLKKKIKLSKEKRNKDLFCLKCWKVYSYYLLKAHLKSFPKHDESVISSKHFASESKFIALCKEFNRIHEIGGSLYVESPYNPASFPQKTLTNFLHKQEGDEEEKNF